MSVISAFLRTGSSGDAWITLLAKLIISSETVAASVVRRQETGRMSMLGTMSRMGR